MQLDNRFNDMTITEESLPEVQIVHLGDTIGIGNDDQMRRNKGRGKGRGKGKKKKQHPKNVESSGDLIGSGSGK
jgi:hypothetical protein